MVADFGDVCARALKPNLLVAVSNSLSASLFTEQERFSYFSSVSKERMK
jgi:hypothetical protein